MKIIHRTTPTISYYFYSSMAFFTKSGWYCDKCNMYLGKKRTKIKPHECKKKGD